MVQLRKQDLRHVGELWVLRITPEAGTVKNNEAREVVLHPDLVAQGFVQVLDEGEETRYRVRLASRRRRQLPLDL